MRTRNKNCYICKKDQKILYRCKFDDLLSWHFLCEPCLDSVKKNTVIIINMVVLGKVKKIINRLL